MNLKEININDYNYILPEDKIAKYPFPKRDDSKLLIYNKGQISDKKFQDIADLLKKEDLLIFNTTKVIQARLLFKKETGANIEIFCLEPELPAEYEQIFQTTSKCRWKCVVGNSKKWKEGKLYSDIHFKNTQLKLSAERISKDNNSQIIEFSWNNSAVNFADILEITGLTPIPPYLKRQSDDNDKIRYQTVYSKQKGSVAAPTAGLHFTNDLINRLQNKGIKISELILHVGAGTFKPVKNDLIEEHEMHTEHFSVNKKLLEDILNHFGKIVSVGTTSVRTLESLYQIGLKLENNIDITKFQISQWEAYESKESISGKQAIKNILSYMDKNKTDKIEATTQIMIVPGYKFKIVNKLITNFHQPKSTLLLLVSAFIGSNYKKVYEYALNNNFRFLSYGDSSILIP